MNSEQSVGVQHGRKRTARSANADGCIVALNEAVATAGSIARTSTRGREGKSLALRGEALSGIEQALTLAERARDRKGDDYDD